MRKPVFGVPDQVRHRPGCTATEDGEKLEISDFINRGIVVSGISRKPDPASRDEKNWVRTQGFAKRRVPGRKFFCSEASQPIDVYLGFGVYLAAACPVAS